MQPNRSLPSFHADPGFSTIYETLNNRLQQVWDYYLTVQDKAETGRTTSLSSAPCTPAPGRRIVIIRCDNQLPPADLFVSFDRVVPPVASKQTLRNDGSLKTDSSDGQPPQKRRWSILKSMFGSSARITDGSSSSDESDSIGYEGTAGPDGDFGGHQQPQNQLTETHRPKTPHQPYTFKFSLEWTDRPQWPSKNKRLFTPCLPVGAQLHVQIRQNHMRLSDSSTASGYSSENDTEDTRSDSFHEASIVDKVTNKAIPSISASDKWQTDAAMCGPSPFDKLVGSKYSGRALAEWGQVVMECDSFVARRRDEGVPADELVETPIMGMESFRK